MIEIVKEDLRIRAISLYQPFANNFYDGIKTIETRWHDTNIREDVLICSTKKPMIEPAGFGLCIVRLYNSRMLNPDDAKDACCDYVPGKWAWETDRLRRLDPILPVTGRQGWFYVTIPAGTRLVHVDDLHPDYNEAGVH